MTHYLDRNSNRVINEIYRRHYGFSDPANQIGTDRLNITTWSVVDNGGTPVAQPNAYDFWFLTQDFDGVLGGPVFNPADPATQDTEFGFWVNQMVEDSKFVYTETVVNGASQYHTNQQKTLLDHQAQLTAWERDGFPGGAAVPHYVQSRYDKVMKGEAGHAPSYVYHYDLAGIRWYALAAGDVVGFGKVAVLALRAENYMTTEESGLIEDAVAQTKKYNNFSQPDPFGDLESKIEQYNGLLLDFDHANPDNWGLKQRWLAMPVSTWESELDLTPVPQ